MMARNLIYLTPNPIQVLDLVEPDNGYGGRQVSHSNVIYNEKILLS